MKLSCSALVSLYKALKYSTKSPPETPRLPALCAGSGPPTATVIPIDSHILLSQDLCFIYYSHCCYNISNKKPCKEGRVHAGSQFQGIVYHVHT